MPKQTKKCRVCGKVYEACRSIKTGSSVFNWREVACSPECGKVYFQQIMSSRSDVSPSCNSGKAEEAVPEQHSAQKRKKSAKVVSASEAVAGAVPEPVISEEEISDQ